MFTSRRLRVPLNTLTEQLTSISPWNAYRPAPLALSRRRTRLDRFLSFTKASLSLFVWALIVCALLAALYDMGQQFVHSSRQSKASDLVITFGTYLLVVLIGLTLMVSRTISSKKHIASIPKNYIPTQAEDVPKAAHDLISAEFDRVALISKLALPKDKVQSGWGRPGTQYADVHFRTAIISVIPTLRGVVQPLLPPTLPSQPSTPSRANSLSPLAPLLAMDPSPVPPALVPLAELLEDHFYRARYARPEPSEEDYDTVLRAVVMVVAVMGPHVKGAAGREERQ